MLRPRAPPPHPPLPSTPGKGVAVGPLLGAGRELIGLQLCGSTSLGRDGWGKAAAGFVLGLRLVSPALQPRPDPASPCTRTSRPPSASRVGVGAHPSDHHCAAIPPR